jgi:hypothetical protein
MALDIMHSGASSTLFGSCFIHSNSGRLTVMDLIAASAAESMYALLGE